MTGSEHADREPSRLNMDPEAMRRLGYDAVDRAVARFADPGAGPAWRMLERDRAEALLREPAPETGTDAGELLDFVEREVIGAGVRVGHPRFLAFVPGSPTFPGVVGEFLAAAHNVFVGSWVGGSGPTMMELVAVDWIREITGLPPGAGGILTSGGSAATLIAVVAARHARLEDRIPGAVIYASDQTHSAFAKAAWIAGFPREAVRLLPAGPDFRLDPAALAGAIAGDRAAGRTPFLIAANAGTTSTGSVDPLPELAALARREGLWLHVDAAYGGFAAITARGREVLAGLAEADSWVFDPHKWLHQGFECGSVLLRRPEELRRAFGVQAEYLQDVRLDLERPNLYEQGLQLTRSFRALKLWLSLKHFGVAAFRAAVDRALDLTEAAGAALAADPAFEVLSPPRLGVVCFRLRASDDRAAEALNLEVLTRLNRSGYAFISSTRLGGRYALRFCVLSHHTGRGDVEGVITRIRELGEAVRGPGA